MAGGDEEEWEELGADGETSEEDLEDDVAEAAPAEPLEATGTEEASEPRRFEDRSRFAMVSGLGFFILGLVVYFLVVAPRDAVLAALAGMGMGLTAAAVYFWMAHDLRVRPRALSRQMARFIAGPLLGLLALVGLATLVVYVGPAAPSNGIGKAVTVFGLEFGTAASVSLLFYSMLWEG